jgi:hypothetical protein
MLQLRTTTSFKAIQQFRFIFSAANYVVIQLAATTMQFNGWKVKPRE